MTTHDTPSPTDDDLDTWLRVLANAQRRAVVTHLRDERECHVRDLAEHVAAESDAATLGNPTPPELDRTLTALVHIHLPMMDDAGLVDWDREAGQVRVGAVPERTPWS